MRRGVSGPPIAMATAASHTAIHRSSVRNSTVFKSRNGNQPAKTAAHQPALREKSAVPIFATNQSDAAKIGIIASRMEIITCAVSPKSRKSGAHRK